MHPDSDLLMQAIMSRPSEAEQCWRRWRAETDLDKMPEDCVRLLPVLVEPSSPWLVDDPAKNLILGILKRAWTRNQIMLRSLAELVTSLRRQGVDEVVVAGPPAWSFLHQRFRPITYLELVVPRALALQSVSILAQAGWTPLPQSSSPDGDALDYVQGIWLQRESGERLRLNWRLFSAPPEFTAEWELLPPGERAEFQGVRLTLLPRDVMFACALAGERGADDLDWRCDMAMLLRGPKIDWRAVRGYIRFAPEARIRLTGLSVPSSAQKEPELSRLRAQWEIVWGEYRLITWKRREARSFRGFLRFLCDRWQARAWQLPFFGLFYMMRYTFSGRTGSTQ